MLAMKKLMFILAVTAGFSATVVASAPQLTEIAVTQEKQYKKIKVSEVSKEAMDKIKANYGAYTVKEAYRADDGDYKLVINKDGIDTTATFTKEGEMIKILN